MYTKVDILNESRIQQPHYNNPKILNMKLDKESLAEQIRKELRDRIVDVEIDQGEKINVAELEEEFGVSRAPVRDALQSLAGQGLVEVKPRVGYFAVELTPKQIKDICEMRKLLESFALSKSIDRVPSNKLKAIREKSLRLKEEDFKYKELRDVFDETDENLHRNIIEKANNELLEDFTERTHNLIGITRHLNERIFVSIEEHLRLIEAILDGDLQKSKVELRRHLDNVEKEILSNHYVR